MSKLIVNTGTLSAGGAERVLSILSSPFADAFDEVQYVMWLDAKYPDIFYSIDPRVKIVKVSKESNSTKIWKQILWYRNYIIKQKPSIVLSFMVMVDFTVSVALLATGIPQVVAERNDPRFYKSIIPRSFVDMIYHSSDIKGILMQTMSNKEFFKQKSLLAKTDVIYNPILMNKNMVNIASNQKKDDLIVSVGRLVKQKKQEDLISAFAKFHKSHPSYKLCIFGEGERRSYLSDIAKKNGVSDYIILPGRSQNVMEEIQKASMFVLSSEYEGMSNALIEAMCLGLPCISTCVSGAKDLINDGDNGFLVDVGDVEMLYKRMTELADNPEFAKVMGHKASEIYKKLSVEIISDKWIKYLKERALNN